MSKYELVVIFTAALEEAKLKELTEKISQLIQSYKAKDIKTQVWGKKELAYLIKKQSLGFYVQYNFELAPKEVISLDKKLKDNEQILRFLLLKG